MGVTRKYYGETNRCGAQRAEEHLADLKKQRKTSPMSSHIKESHPDKIGNGDLFLFKVGKPFRYLMDRLKPSI